MRAILLSLVSACSFVFVSSPPATPTSTSACTETPVPPIADAVIATGAIAGGIAALMTTNNCNPNNSDCSAATPRRRAHAGD